MQQLLGTHWRETQNNDTVLHNPSMDKLFWTCVQTDFVLSVSPLNNVPMTTVAQDCGTLRFIKNVISHEICRALIKYARGIFQCWEWSWWGMVGPDIGLVLWPTMSWKSVDGCTTYIHNALGWNQVRKWHQTLSIRKMHRQFSSTIQYNHCH